MMLQFIFLFILVDLLNYERLVELKAYIMIQQSTKGTLRNVYWFRILDSSSMIIDIYKKDTR